MGKSAIQEWLDVWVHEDLTVCFKGILIPGEVWGKTKEKVHKEFVCLFYFLLSSNLVVTKNKKTGKLGVFRKGKSG